MDENLKSKKIIYLEKILRLMAKAVLKRHRPKIVAITGSVGKTSTKTAVFKVLVSKFSVRENQKNYNNEIGIPLTIIGAESGGRNIFKWIWVLLKWLVVLILPIYPEILILELGIDRPKDMKYFMSFINPTVSIVTNVSLSHIEFFKTVENIAKEKRVIIENLSPDGFAILNADDELVLQMAGHTKGHVLTFGLSEEADVVASNLIYNYQEDAPAGISFKLNYDGKNIPVRLKNILAAHYVYAALSAIAAGTVFKMNLVDISNAIESLRSPVGRMNLVEGKNGSYIIDDTYNGSPMSTVAALEVLGQLRSKRKIAILGDMLELGDQEEFGHREVGKKVSAIKADLFVAVGSRMQSAVAQLIAAGFPSGNIVSFEDPDLAGEEIEKLVKEGDYILVKGSQGMRMEKVVKKLMKNPDNAKKLLCRQSPEWLKKPFVKP